MCCYGREDKHDTGLGGKVSMEFGSPLERSLTRRSGCFGNETARITLFHPEPSNSSAGSDLCRVDFGAGRRLENRAFDRVSVAFAFCSLRLFPVTATTVVSSVVSSAATAVAECDRSNVSV